MDCIVGFLRCRSFSNHSQGFYYGSHYLLEKGPTLARSLRRASALPAICPAILPIRWLLCSNFLLLEAETGSPSSPLHKDAQGICESARSASDPRGSPDRRVCRHSPHRPPAKISTDGSVRLPLNESPSAFAVGVVYKANLSALAYSFNLTSYSLLADVARLSKAPVL